MRKNAKKIHVKEKDENCRSLKICIHRYIKYLFTDM